MIRLKVCECCGKRFVAKSDSKKYCSKTCKSIMLHKQREENGQLCWLCKNACGECNWSKYFKPVDGWVAEPTIIKDSMGNFSSYKIKKCPEFTRV